MHPLVAATLAHNIQELIFQVAKALLYPVLIALLVCLAWAVVEVGWLAYELYLRIRYRDLEELEIRTLKARDAFANGQPRRAYRYLQENTYSLVVVRFLFDLIRNYQTERIPEKPIKLLQDYEFYTMKRLEKTRILVRVGPMLGLMGTLIPLAPALVALAHNNTRLLSENLTLAFSATVIGLLIGGLGFLVSIVRDRIYQQDISDLEYVLELLEGGGGRLRIGPPRRLHSDVDEAPEDLPDEAAAAVALAAVEAAPDDGAGAPQATPAAPTPEAAPTGLAAAPAALEPVAPAPDRPPAPVDIFSWRALGDEPPSAAPAADNDAAPPVSDDQRPTKSDAVGPGTEPNAGEAATEPDADETGRLPRPVTDDRL